MKNYYIFLITLLFIVMSSCQKEFLDKKPSKSLLVPTTLDDLQALLNNNDLTGLNSAPGLGEVACDDFYRLEPTISSLTVTERNTYLWQPDINQGASVSDWNAPYQGVFYANVVLDGLKNIVPTTANQDQYNQIKGSSLFFRGSAFFHLAQSFTVPYDASTSTQVDGIPIRLTSDVNYIAGRGTLQETYDQIKSDLLEAIPLLPLKGLVPTRPSKAAAYGYLARYFLITGDYKQAAFYAGQYLSISSTLIDFNTLSATAAAPLPFSYTGANAEALYHVLLTGYAYNTSASTYVVPALYQAYESNDLRKTCFFADRGNGNYSFKGSYTGGPSSFGAPATDEILLIRAEAFARTGDVTGALKDLNALLEKRYKKGLFVPLALSDGTGLLNRILIERRKELLGRGLRWQDLRRLNKDPAFEKTLSRTYSGQVYTLLPNSNRYVFPIPDNEINGSGIAQNLR